MVKVRCLHRLEECDLPLCECACDLLCLQRSQQGNLAVPVCHMAQELCVMSRIVCFYSSCDGPEAVGEFKDCHCSL